MDIKKIQYICGTSTADSTNIVLNYNSDHTIPVTITSVGQGRTIDLTLVEAKWLYSELASMLRQAA